MQRLWKGFVVAGIVYVVASVVFRVVSLHDLVRVRETLSTVLRPSAPVDETKTENTV